MPLYHNIAIHKYYYSHKHAQNKIKLNFKNKEMKYYNIKYNCV